MHKTTLEQIAIFKIADDPEITTRLVNDFVIIKFAQCGNYPDISQSGEYVTVTWKQLVETSYEPPKLEFININTSGIPDDWQEKPKKRSLFSRLFIFCIALLALSCHRPFYAHEAILHTYLDSSHQLAKKVPLTLPVTAEEKKIDAMYWRVQDSLKKYSALYVREVLAERYK